MTEPTPQAEGTPAAPPPFEAILGELESLVARLEAGSLPLDESLRVFERGMQLARQGGAMLEAAERKVEVLVRDQTGELTREPFDSGGERE